MKVKNRHGRVGVKTPLSHTQRRADRLGAYKKGYSDATAVMLLSIQHAKSLRELKRELGL